MPTPTIFELLKKSAPLVGPGVYDCVSARLAERAGFKMVFLSGYCLSASLLGEPDFGFISETQMMDAAARIVPAVGIPVIVDIDTGYGNAFNVERAVERLLSIGAAGCFLEDQVFPKRCGHMEGKEVVPLKEYLPKLKAALKTRGSAPFHITARTDARAAVNLEEALERAKAFAGAGADAVFVEAPQSREELEKIRAAVPKGIMCVANMVEKGKTPLLKAGELYKMGFQIIASPVSPLLSAAWGMRGLYETLARDEITTAWQEKMFVFDEMNELTGLPEKYKREKEWRS